MTDMRATERLLEVIEDSLPAIEAHMVGSNGLPDELVQVYIAIKELRRRGDTLVRRDDLRMLLEQDESIFGSRSEIHAQQDAFVDARERLENAIGGKP